MDSIAATWSSVYRTIVEGLGRAPHPRSPFAPRSPVVAVPVHQIVCGVRHLVEQRVDAFRPIPLEHQVDVQRDLDHIALILSPARQHVAERRVHSTAQAYRHIDGQDFTESRLVEIPINGPEIASLARRGTAVCHTPFSARRRAQARLVLGARLFHRSLKFRPFMNASTSGPGVRCRDATLSRNHRKGVEQLGRRATVGDVHVKRRASLRQRPNRASVPAKRYPTKLECAAAAELVQKLLGCEGAHGGSKVRSQRVIELETKPAKR